jgi:hypothetical protein
MAHDSYGFLRGKWARVQATLGGSNTEVHFRVEDETDDTLCGLDSRGARVVIAKRCIEAAFEAVKSTTDIRTEKGIHKAASKLRERRRET